MAQDWGVAEPLKEFPKHIMEIYDRLRDTRAPSVGHQDTSWHDEMVREANESFREAAAKSKAAAQKATSKPSKRSR